MPRGCIGSIISTSKGQGLRTMSSGVVLTQPVFQQLSFTIKVAESDLLLSVTVDGVVSGTESQIRGASHLAVEQSFLKDCR